MSLQNKDIAVSNKENIRSLIQKILGLGGSMMYWRLPNSEERTLIVCNSGAKVTDEITLEGTFPGFAFAPFNRQQSKYFFNADLVFRFKGEELIDGPDLNNTNFFSGKTESFDKNESRFYFKEEKKEKISEYFPSFVEACVQMAQQGAVEKIVPSKSMDINLPENFDVLQTFNKFCDKHPNAFVSLVTSPETGTWIGASPELLVSIDAEDKFKTIALAGTQKFTHGVNLKSVAWTQKEIEEQALVSRYIINCFKKIRVREYAEQGPHTVVAGSLLHLRTDYEVDMKEVNFPQLGSVMLKLLHPTSAVCGMPFEPAVDFLLKNEGYDREFYSGFLGPVNMNGESKMFVNLRCMQIFESKARLYAGAGVTADSVAEKEVEEIEMKLKTLAQILNP
ncbi:MAG TPA: isochorismate synthase [Cytophagales bacterium]|jgi:isochorismate synthase|nr:isochorismate synthase [Cytophagales bacterium]